MDLSPSIVSKLILGHNGAWTSFVDAAAPVIIAQVRRCFARYSARLDIVDIEDVSQEVFIKLSQKNFALLRKYDPERARLNTYLGIVAHSVSVDYLRKRTVKHETVDDYSLQLAAPGQFQQSDLKQITSLVPATLLSDRQCLVLKKLFDEDLDVLDLAKELGTTAQTIRSTKHKALAKLRQHFENNPNLRDAA